MLALLTRLSASSSSKKSWLAAALALAFLALPATSQAATINGTLRKMTDSTVISGVKIVWLAGAVRTDSTVTDSLGAYTLLNVTTGTRTVEASKVGYSTLTNTVNVANNAATYTSNFYLGTPATLSGTVRKSTDSTVLANASVYLRRTSATNPIQDSAKTDSLGAYAFANLTPGTPNYYVTASLASYITGTNSNIALASGGAVVSTVYLTPVLPGSISGTVRKAADSTAITGVKIYLRRTSTTSPIQDSTVSNGSGAYSFIGLVAGTPNYYLSFSATGFAPAANSNIAVGNGASVTSNVYMTALGKITARVRKLADSTNLANVLVLIRRGTIDTSAILDSGRTDSLGAITFSNLTASTGGGGGGATQYRVYASLAGYINAQNNAISVTNGVTTTTNLYLGTVGSISGTVRKAADSTVVAGAKLYLRRTSATNPIQDSTVSDGSGAYAFANLNPGTPNYYITASATNLVQGTNSNIVVASGANTVSNLYLLGLGKITARVRKLADSTNIAGALVMLRRGTSDTTAILDSGRTDSLGAYTFANLAASGGNNYRVYVVASGFVNNSNTGIVVTNGTTTTTNLYLGTPGSISGTVRKATDSTVIAGASVYLRRTSATNPVQDSAKTDSLGAYAFANLTPGTPNYYVSASAANFLPGTNSNIAVGSGAAVVSTVYLTPVLPGNISGTVRKAADSTAIAGSKIYLRRTSTTSPIQDSTVSDSVGHYAFAGLTAGTPNYYVTFTAAGFASASNSNIAVGNGASVTSNIYLATLGKITARVRKLSDSTNVAGALVMLRRGTSDTTAILDSGRTDSLGAYTFANLAASGGNNYRVYAVASGFVNGSNTGIVVTNGTTTTTNLYLSAPGSISGSVRKATDSTVIAGASVYLRRTSATNPVQDSAKTDSLGAYAFANLTPGTPNYYVTASAASFLPGTNSNIAVGNGAAVVSTIYLTPVLPGSISGTVRKAADSAAIAGSKIYLRRTSTTSPIQDSTVSDSVGHYAFTGLVAGTPNYYLSFNATGFAPGANSNIAVGNGASVTSNVYLTALGRITARIRKLSDSTNIANALVWLRRGTSDTTAILDSGRTDSLGAYTFANLTASTGGGGGGATQYRVYASASGFVNAQNNAITVTNGVTTTTNLYLGVPGSISGTVRKASDSTVLANTSIYLRRTSATSAVLDSAKTDSLGHYAFASVNSGTPNYWITAVRAAYVSATNASVAVASGAAVTSNFYLTLVMPGSISGTVRRAADTTLAIANALVRLRRGSDTAAILDTARTDSLGHYSFANLVAGTPNYWISALATGFLSGSNTNVTVPNGGNVVSNFSLVLPATLSGTIRRMPDSLALKNALVLMRRGGATSAIVDSARTDSLGHYGFGNLIAATNYRITASAPGYTTASNTNINVTAGSSVISDRVLAVAARGRIYGKVGIAGDSAIIINALIVLRAGSATAAIQDSTRSDSTGRYAFADLITGAPGYWLTASASGFNPDNNDSVTVAANDSTLSDFALTIVVGVHEAHTVAQRVFTATRLGNEWVIRLPASTVARKFEMRDVRGVMLHQAIVPAGATQITLPAGATKAGVVMSLK